MLQSQAGENMFEKINEKFDKLEIDFEKMKEKYLKNNDLSIWKCSINSNLNKEELRKWNTDNPDNMWKIKIKK